MEAILTVWIFINIFVLFILIAMSIEGDANFSFVNPLVIYDNLKVNWFGAWFLATLFNVVLPAVAIPYWIYKICTVGR